jgi:hypothetical protein
MASAISSARMTALIIRRSYVSTYPIQALRVTDAAAIPLPAPRAKPWVLVWVP